MTIYPSGPQDGVKYTLTGQDGNIATFNDPTDANYVGMVRWEGLDSSDIRESLEDRAGADGASQGNNYRGRRSVVGTVEILGTSTIDRNQKWQKLKRAANNLRASGSLKWTPDGGAPEMAVNVRLNQPLRRPSESGWLHHCQLALMAADPYIYSTALHTSTVNASPWQATITNQGDGLSAPSIAVTVTAAGTLLLQNVTTGQVVELDSVDPAAVFGAYSLTFAPGTTGSGNGQLSTPTSMAVDAAGNVYVADSGNNRVQKFDSTGAYVSQFGSAGTGNGQFNGVGGIAFDGAGKIWVCDRGNNRIQRFSAAGAYETQFGTAGAGNGQFNNPLGIAIDGAGNIFVADTVNNRIQKLTAGTPPTYASQLGTAGTGNGQFNWPTALVVDSGGTNLWVVDTNNHRVQKVTNASPPVYVSQFGAVGAADGQLSFPWGITRDSANLLYVADRNNNRVQRFSTAGVYQAKFGTYGTGPGKFNGPVGVAMLGSTTTPLYIADTGGADVQKVLLGTLVVELDFSSTGVIVSGNNYYSKVNVPASTWWTLRPGDNVIQVTGGSSWTISWRDAWL